VGDYYTTEKKTLAVDFELLELTLGARRNFFINKKSKLFLDALLVIDFPIKNIKTEGEDVINEYFYRSGGVALRVGYQYNNRFSLGLKYHISKNVLNSNNEWNSTYEAISLMLGYTIF